MATVKITGYQWNYGSNGYRHLKRVVRNPQIFRRFDRNGIPHAEWEGEITFFGYPRSVRGFSWGSYLEEVPGYWTD